MNNSIWIENAPRLFYHHKCAIFKISFRRQQRLLYQSIWLFVLCIITTLNAVLYPPILGKYPAHHNLRYFGVSIIVVVILMNFEPSNLTIVIIFCRKKNSTKNAYTKISTTNCIIISHLLHFVHILYITYCTFIIDILFIITNDNW